MPEIDTPFGKIIDEQVTIRRYVVDGKEFRTLDDAKRERFRKASSDLLAFARWVVAVQGDIPDANIPEVLPILKKVRDSGLDYAAMAAAEAGVA